MYKRILALLLSLALMLTLIDERAFANTRGAVLYSTVYYDTIGEALEDAASNEDKDIQIFINSNLELTETIEVAEGTKVTISANEKKTIEVKQDIEAVYVYEGGELCLNNIILDGNKESIQKKKENYAIKSYGMLELINSDIQNFYSSKATVYMNGATLEMDDTSYIKNNNHEESYGKGGAIVSMGTSYISGGHIQQNQSSYYGGGIYSEGTLYIDETTIKENIARIGGGIDGDALYINGCTIEGNQGNYYGGGVYTASTGNLEIYNSCITKNKATIVSSTGGGIYISGNRNIKLAGVTINENEAKNAAGLSVHNGTLTIAKAGNYDTPFGTETTGINEISSNITEGNGGGIKIESGVVADIEQCNITDNLSGSGGGIYSEGVLNLYDVVISENTATGTNNNNALTVYKGVGVYNSGIINLYENADIIDQIYLTEGRTVTIKEALCKYTGVTSGANGENNATDQITVAVDERISVEFRVIAEYELDETQNHKLSSETAYADIIKGLWNLESVALEDNKRVTAVENQIGLTSAIYTKSIECVNDTDTGVQNVDFKIYKEKNGTYVLVGKSKVTDADGKVNITGLTDGNYYVQLKSIPQGYKKNSKRYEFSVGENIENVSIKINLGAHNGIPNAVIDNETTKVKVGEMVNFSAASSTDDNGIELFSWGFGDGYSDAGMEVEHFYQKEGDYAVVLTVKDAEGRTSTVSQHITVEGYADSAATVTVTVKSSKDESVIPNALLSVTDNEGNVVAQGISDSNGNFSMIIQRNETYGMSVGAEGYYVRTTNVCVEEEQSSITMYLLNENIMIAEIETQEMDIDDIEEAWIDKEAIENSKLVRHRVMLTFIEDKSYLGFYFYVDEETSRCFYNPKGYGLGSNHHLYAMGDTRALYFLIVDGTTKWQKDMFDVKLYVYNLSTVETLTNVEASINLPKGLSLATMNGDIENNSVKELPDIQPGGGAITNWYVRGDENGDYYFSATVKGDMTSEASGTEPQHIEQTYTSTEPLRVRAGDSMFVDIVVDRHTSTGESYTIKYKYTNISEKTLYNLRFTFDREIQYADDGEVFTLSYNPGQEAIVRELAPGESVSVKYSTLISFKDIRGNSIPLRLMAHAFIIIGGNSSLRSKFTVNENPSRRVTKTLSSRSSRRSYSGDPVNMLTGAFEYEYTDYTLKGRYDLEFTRKYDSAREEDIGFGKGFVHNYHYTLEQKEDYVIVKYPVGDEYVFETKGIGTYIEGTGKKLEITGARYVLYDCGVEYIFDAYKRLISITEKDGWKTWLNYDNNGNLTEIESNAGTINLVWGESHITSITDGTVSNQYMYSEGLLSTVRNPEGDILTYIYDENDKIEVIKDFCQQDYLKNIYDEYGRVIVQEVRDEGTYNFTYDDEKRINTCTQEEGYTHTIEYNEDFLITKDTQAEETKYQYNAFGQMISAEDADGITTYGYDANGNLSLVLYPDDTTEFYTYNYDSKLTEYKNRNDNYMKYEYDTNGHLIKETDARGNSTTYEYDIYGNRIKETTPEGNVISYAYNSKGLLTRKADMEEHVWEYSYDSSGRLTYEKDSTGSGITYIYSAAGKLTSIVDTKGATDYVVNGNGYNETIKNKNDGITTKQYDAANRVVKEVTPGGYETTFTYDTLGNLITEVLADGGVMTFVYDKKGNVISQTDACGNEWNNKYDAKGRITESYDPYKKVTKLEYDTNGYLEKQTDANGNVTTYTYDSMGYLLYEEDGEKNTQTYEYDENGNLVKYKDKNGNIITYEYDKDNRLEKEESEKGITTYAYDCNGNLIRKTETGDIVTEYEYNGEGKLINMKDPEGNEISYTYDTLGNLLTVTYPDNGVITYTYDKMGNILSIKDEEGFYTRYTYNKENLADWEKDNNGNQFYYTYDFRGNERIIEGPLYITKKAYDKRGLLTEETTKLGTTYYEYDKLGRLIKETSPGGAETTYTYDNTVNPKTVTDAEGNVTAYTYDANGNVLTVTDGEGKKTTYTYDGNGNLLTETDPLFNVITYTYDSMDNVITKKDALNNTVQYEYDYKGNMISYTDAEGTITTYGYDKNGNCTSITDGLNNTITYEYNFRGDLIKEISAEGIVKNYTYDKKGNLLTETDGNGYITRYTYDGNGNCLSKTKGSMQENYTYDQADRLTSITYRDNTVESYTYDINGNMETYKDRMGRVTFYEYDADSNLTKTTDPLGNITTYTYDKVGNLKEVVMYRDKNDESTKEVTSYEYDGCNRVSKETDAAGNVTVYEYDKTGNLLNKKMEGTSTVLASYTYGPTGLMETKNEGSGTVSYSYNKNGELVQMETSGNTTAYTRDVLDRIIQVNIDNVYTVKNEYDRDGNRTKLTYPDGLVVEYEYDGNGNISKMIEGDNTTGYFYTAEGSVTAKTVNGKTTNMYAYDTNGRIIGAYEADGKNLYEVEGFVYDANGNITTYRDNISQGKIWNYTYDALDRLTGESYTQDGATHSNSYTYDDVGNLVQETKGSNTYIYEYNNLNQLIRKYNPEDVNYGYVSDGNTYQYDANGNTSAIIRILGYTTRYTASTDANGKILSGNRQISGGELRNALVNYTYDGLGNAVSTRTRKTYINRQTDVTTTRIYDHTLENPVVLAEYSTDGTMVTYTYGADSKKETASIKNNYAINFVTAKKYELTRDYKNSLREAKDSEGNVVASTEYNAWGEVTGESGIEISANVGTLMLTKSYTGYIYDDGIALWNAGARMYNPSDKRFMSEDPEAGNVYEPVRINRYIYAGDNPVVNVDTDGRMFGSFSRVVCGFKSAIRSAVRDVISYASDAVKTIVNSPIVRTVRNLYDAAWKTYDSMSGWKKAVIGTVGFTLFAVTGGGISTATTLAATSLATGGLTGGLQYAFEAMGSETWDNNQFVEYVINGALNDYGASGSFAGVVGVAKYAINNRGRFASFWDESGEFGVKSGSKAEIPLLETTKPITGKTNDHHIIPAFRGKSKPYADFIAERGIDVDQYTITVDAGKGGLHMNDIHGKGGWNQNWMQYIDDNPNATAKDIYQFAGKMLDDYGLSGYTIHPYGGK